jgi:hypothetical protein
MKASMCVADTCTGCMNEGAGVCGANMCMANVGAGYT